MVQVLLMVCLPLQCLAYKRVIILILVLLNAVHNGLTALKSSVNDLRTYVDVQDYSLQTERRFQEVDKRCDRQGAMSTAMMNMVLSTNGLRGQNRVGIGVDLPGQESAIAVEY